MRERETWETEAAARARAERDSATRDRITYAAEILAGSHLYAPGAPALAPGIVRQLHRARKIGLRHAMAAGLTRGEAQAAGFR